MFALLTCQGTLYSIEVYTEYGNVELIQESSHGGQLFRNMVMRLVLKEGAGGSLVDMEYSRY